MGRLIFWILLIVAAMLAWRWLGRRNARGANSRGDAGGQPDGTPAEAMIACSHCGVHLPRSEAEEREGRLYCGAEHARLGTPPRP